MSRLVPGRGKVEFVADAIGRREGSAESILERLREGLRDGAKRGVYRAAAIFADVEVTPPGARESTDAVRVTLEHESGLCREIFVPYRIGAAGGVELGEPFAAGAERTIFPAGGGP